MSHAYHITVAVSDIAKSVVFYDAMFTLLGWTTKHEDSESKAYSDGSFDLWIVPAATDATASKDAVTGYNHLAIRVDNRALVDSIYEWLLSVDAKIDIAPKMYPQYSENYYAVFFFDPDGTRLEAVCC